MEQRDTDQLGGLLRAARPEQPGGLARTLGMEILRARVIGAASARLHVGRYVIESKLGEGGMGAVFRARDPELDREVAIKVLHAQADEKARARMGREARALARLNQENVLIVHDMGTQGDQVWIAMEYVRGGNLRQWRRTNTGASWREVTRIFLAAARGLATAHRAGVVHRDFKPDNVMVGDDGRVRVADFGLARLETRPTIDRHRDSDLLSMGGAALIVGTPVYLSPEALRGERATPRADQFSFFVALREMLDAGGEAPREHLPPRLQVVIDRGTSRRPEERWSSMDEVVAQLEALLSAPAPDPRRRVLLDRVEQLWIDGVRATSLAGRKPVELALREVAEQVAPPSRDWPEARAGLARARAPARRSTATLAAELDRAHGSLLLLGPPGSGKTTALLELTRELIERARNDATEPAPVVLNLASLSSFEGPLNDWIVDELVTKYSLSRRHVQGWLDDDALLLVLDGLDEVSAPRRRACVESINTFRAGHPVGMVIACRNDNYVSIGAQLSLGTALHVEPLDDEAVAHLLGSGGAASISRESAAAAGRSPLLLSLLASAGRDDGDAAAGSRAIYDAYVRRALSRRPALSPSESARFVARLSCFSMMLERAGSSDFWLERLQADWLAGRARRAAGAALGGLLILALVFGGNVLATRPAERPLLVGVILGGLCVAAVLLLNRGIRVRPVEALRWSYRLSLRRLPWMIALGLVGGAIFGAIYILWVNVVFGLTGALVVSVILGLEPTDRDARVRPGSRLWQSVRNGLLVGPACGIAVGAAVGYVAVPLVLPHAAPSSMLHVLSDPKASLFITLGAFAGLLGAFVYGGAAATLHIAVRFVVAATTPLPFRLAPFLDEAVERGLLRRVGGGWMFQHLTLLDYFRGAGVGGDAGAGAMVGEAGLEAVKAAPRDSDR